VIRATTRAELVAGSALERIQHQVTSLQNQAQILINQACYLARLPLNLF